MVLIYTLTLREILSSFDALMNYTRENETKQAILATMMIGRMDQ